MKLEEKTKLLLACPHCGNSATYYVGHMDEIQKLIAVVEAAFIIRDSKKGDDFSANVKRMKDALKALEESL